jgi:hypothetical protein
MIRVVSIFPAKIGAAPDVLVIEGDSSVVKQELDGIFLLTNSVQGEASLLLQCEVANGGFKNLSVGPKTQWSSSL